MIKTADDQKWHQRLLWNTTSFEFLESVRVQIQKRSILTSLAPAGKRAIVTIPKGCPTVPLANFPNASSFSYPRTSNRLGACYQPDGDEGAERYTDDHGTIKTVHHSQWNPEATADREAICSFAVCNIVLLDAAVVECYLAVIARVSLTNDVRVLYRLR